MLLAPMPRVWDYTSHDDTVEALSPECSLGAGIDADGLRQLQREMRHKASSTHPPAEHTKTPFPSVRACTHS